MFVRSKGSVDVASNKTLRRRDRVPVGRRAPILDSNGAERLSADRPHRLPCVIQRPFRHCERCDIPLRTCGRLSTKLNLTGPPRGPVGWVRKEYDVASTALGASNTSAKTRASI